MNDTTSGFDIRPTLSWLAVNLVSSN